MYMSKNELHIKEKLPSRLPFKLPDGYFDRFTIRLEDSMSKVEERTTRLISWHQHAVFRYGTAAAIAILVTLSVLYYWSNNSAITRETDEYADLLILEYSGINAYHLYAQDINTQSNNDEELESYAFDNNNYMLATEN